MPEGREPKPAPDGREDEDDVLTEDLFLPEPPELLELVAGLLPPLMVEDQE